MTVRTKLVIEVESKVEYSNRDLQKVAEIISNFLAGPDGAGIVMGKTIVSQEDRHFLISSVRVSRPEEPLWVIQFSEPGR
jgi:hypothetical protein